MFELIALAVAAAAGVAGHVQSRAFVAKKLRYTRIVERPALGLWAGVGATLLAAPFVAVLPIVGAGTAIAVGTGVGTGVALGVKDTRDGRLIED